MVRHPSSHSEIRQACLCFSFTPSPQIYAERQRRIWGHNICLPSEVGHPATSSISSHTTQPAAAAGAERLKERALEGSLGSWLGA
ncbi:hypothetical protein BDA96_10G024900 [Sorghum bicolor]|uniref:Uncharacterized protein n=1 Tax=Sorghum bicolor TaxID=4558 RepID=A0A921TY17_SORBI|nr:hypothetical protein BDA96_10G024900 [Sorghum bicolor]